MRCTCPKCSANIELDLVQVPEAGTSVRCSECMEKFLLRRESFAARACWHADETSCVNCGAHLGYLTYCPACFALYPDYFVHKPSRWNQLRTSWWEAISFGGRSRNRSATPAYTPVPGRAGNGYANDQAPSVSVIPKSSLIKAGVALLLVLLVVAGTATYSLVQKRQAFTDNFFLALYGIKTGTALSIKASEKTAAEWKTRLTTGQNVIPPVSADDATQLGKIKNQVDSVMQSLDKPPSAFTGSMQRLAKLYGTYTRIYALTVAPSGTLSGFTDSLDRLNDEYKQAAKDFKTNMPPKMLKEFDIAKTKHRGLRDF
jgi:predicted Zn finger-like uncharacterized protein